MAAAEGSLVHATGLFHTIWINLSPERKREIKDVLLPCLNVWLRVRRNTIAALEKVAREADQCQSQWEGTADAAEWVAVGGIFTNVIGTFYQLISSPISKALTALTVASSTTAVAAKGVERAQMTRLAERFETAFKKDCIESAQMRRYFRLFTGLNDAGMAQVREFVAESAREGVFNSITKANQFMTLLELLADDNAVTLEQPPNMLTPSLDLLHELEADGNLDEAVRKTIRDYIQDRSLASSIMRNGLQQLGNGIGNTVLANFFITGVEGNVLSIGAGTAGVILKIVRHVYKNTKPPVSEGIRASIDDLKEKTYVFENIRGTIMDSS